MRDNPISPFYIPYKKGCSTRISKTKVRKYLQAQRMLDDCLRLGYRLGRMTSVSLETVG